jgi:hypothetical protein
MSANDMRKLMETVARFSEDESEAQKKAKNVATAVENVWQTIGHDFSGEYSAEEVVELSTDGHRLATFGFERDNELWADLVNSMGASDAMSLVADYMSDDYYMGAEEEEYTDYHDFDDVYESDTNIPFGKWVEYDADSLEAVVDELHRDAGYYTQFGEDFYVFYEITGVKSKRGTFSPRASDPEEYHGYRTVNSEPKYVILFNDNDQMMAMDYDKMPDRSLQYDAEMAADEAAQEQDVSDSDFDPRY